MIAMKAMKGKRCAMKAMKVVTFPTRARWKGVPKMPTKGEPVDYNGGRIYFSGVSFRCIREPPNYATEKSFRIGRFANAMQAFLYACQSIDDYYNVD